MQRWTHQRSRQERHIEQPTVIKRVVLIYECLTCHVTRASNHHTAQRRPQAQRLTVGRLPCGNHTRDGSKQPIPRKCCKERLRISIGKATLFPIGLLHVQKPGIDCHLVAILVSKGFLLKQLEYHASKPPDSEDVLLNHRIECEDALFEALRDRATAADKPTAPANTTFPAVAVLSAPF